MISYMNWYHDYDIILEGDQNRNLQALCLCFKISAQVTALKQIVSTNQQMKGGVSNPEVLGAILKYFTR